MCSSWHFILFWLDPLIFDWSEEELASKIEALQYIVGQTLGAPEGTVKIPKRGL